MNRDTGSTGSHQIGLVIGFKDRIRVVGVMFRVRKRVRAWSGVHDGPDGPVDPVSLYVLQ